jgi:L-seryl-tRNA(Ser) seleniumtransferase
MIATPLGDLEKRASAIAGAVAGAATLQGRSMIGGGSLPEEGLLSRLIALPGEARAATNLAARLRERSVVARVEDGHVLLDPRTIDPSDDPSVIAACVAALGIG